MTQYNNRDFPNHEVDRDQDRLHHDSGRPAHHTTQLQDNLTHRERPIPSNVAYRDGFIQGRLSQDRIDAARLRERDNENAGRGLLMGILLTSLVALTLGTMFALNRRNETNQVPALIVPQTRTVPAPSPQIRERIIERDRVVPVPQAPATGTTTAPSNIAVPSTAPQTTAPQSGTTDDNAPSTVAPNTTNPTTGGDDTSTTDATEGTTGQ